LKYNKLECAKKTSNWYINEIPLKELIKIFEKPDLSAGKLIKI
jgi:hypothetical protein